MKLAYLTSRYPALSHTFILREVRALRECGIDVHTFSVRRTDAGALYTLAEKEEGKRTFAILPTAAWKVLCAHALIISTAPKNYFRALRMAWRCRPPGTRSAVWHLFYFGEAAILAAEIRRRGIEHVHAHFANVASTVAMLASRISGITWSMTLHGTAEFGDPRAVCLVEKIKAAALVICVSDFGRAQAMSHSSPDCWNKIHVVHCGVDPTRVAPAVRKQVETGERPIRLLNVGRLHPEKGQLILLLALRRVLDEISSVTCTLVGAGPQSGLLQEKARELHIADVVAFPGEVGQDVLQTHYEAADVFVLPSFAEGLPVVLMEAMAKELPVVASQIMGIPELVQDGVNGLLVPPGRAIPLANAILRLARDPEMRQRMGAAGRKKVCEEFDVNASAEQLSHLFHATLMNAPGHSCVTSVVPMLETSNT